MTITIDVESWHKGLIDGADGVAFNYSLAGKKGVGCDGYSYSAGYIEGQAFRQGYEVALTDAQAIMRHRAAVAANVNDR